MFFVFKGLQPNSELANQWTKAKEKLNKSD